MFRLQQRHFVVRYLVLFVKMTITKLRIRVADRLLNFSYQQGHREIIMKKWEYLLLFLAFLVAGKAMAITTVTGCGDLIYNSQVIAHYVVTPGTNLNADVSFIDTNCPSNDTINQTASCAYYQMHNPSMNMNCS